MATAEQNTALVTGASAGLGRAVARELVHRGWRVIGTARRADRLHEVAGIVALPGDVADPNHRAEIAATVRELGRLDLLMNNASRLGPSPLPKLADLDPAELVRIARNECRLRRWRSHRQCCRGCARRTASCSTSAPTRPSTPTRGGAVTVRSKAALDQLSAVLARRGTGPAGVRVRPRRHAHRDAPGGVPGRGHLRPARTGDRGARAAARCSRAGRRAVATARARLGDARRGRR